jgi:hypothetical protein
MPFAGFHAYDLIVLIALAFIWLLPLAIGFLYVRQDADRMGQPGIVWALLTIPLGWLAIILYLVARMIRGVPAAR